jgi:dTDP-glucose pyrophosphorylase/predicted transcriptional regulator
MNRWKEILISPDITIIKAIEIIDTSSLQIALVVNDTGKLLGTVTDGDIRRAILKGVALANPVSTIMYCEPTIAYGHESREAIIATMKTKQLRQIPLVDEAGCVIGLDVWDDIVNTPKRENLVFLMAGGLGSRLGELTRDCPKPLLHVGNKPVLETILENCKEYGFSRYCISVNYKADMLKEYFGDGSRWGIDIEYIEENKRLGTAGALSLLPERPSLPLLVMNSDVLTKINFKHLMDFHEEHTSVATMCVREYDFQVPYGVVKIDNQKLQGIEEKPVHRFFVSAGINVLNPDVLNFVPKGEYFDMPSLFEKMLKQKIDTSVFPIHEYWLDIGKIDDYERANGEYSGVFL